MRCRSEAGFTLLETLVAVTMLALLCGALMPLFQQGLTLLERGDRHGRAVLLAQGLLERQVASPDGDAAQSGESGDFVRNNRHFRIGVPTITTIVDSKICVSRLKLPVEPGENHAAYKLPSLNNKAISTARSKIAIYKYIAICNTPNLKLTRRLCLS